MKLYSGYYAIDADYVKFEIKTIEVEKDELYSDTYHMKGYYMLSPNYSTNYITKEYLDRKLKLNFGIVMYSFNKNKILQWLGNVKESETRKASSLLDHLLNSQIMEVDCK